MAHTFDIRFERSGGLGALLASPENSFRWKGAGELRIDREGISFAVKRGLLALFPLTRRVPAGQIREVYREGEALHLTFTTADRAQARVSCWAADASTAAEIVQLLPTRRTVELEHTTDRLAGDRPRYDRRVLAMLCVVAAAGAAIWLWPRHSGITAPDALPLVEAPVIPAEVNLAPPALLPPEEFVVPIPADSPYFAIARAHLGAFEQDAEVLLEEYRVDRALLDSGAIDAETFANRLGALELRWWDVTYRILDDPGFAALSLVEFRATLLAAARQWRAFLASNGAAVRNADHIMISKSFDELTVAEKMQARARLYLH
jgi:hypothetical protein